MKKILLLAMLFVSMTAVMAQNSEGFIEVSNAQELKAAIQTNNSAKIQLMSDISAPDLRQICKTFSGTITGKHKEFIAELNEEVDAMYSIDGGRDKGGKTTWLFDKVDGATFEYICFKNFRVEYNNFWVGMISRHAKNSTFSNLNFENISIYNSDNIAGLISGSADSCRFEYILTRFCDVTTDGTDAGGLVGISGNSKYMLCVSSLNSSTFADGYNGWGIEDDEAESGGFMGMSSRDTLIACLNASVVGADCPKIGGFSGIGENSKYTACNNVYNVISCDEDPFRSFINKTRNVLRNLTLEEKLNLDNRIVEYGAFVGVNIADNVFMNAFIGNLETTSQNNMSKLSVYYWVKKFMENSSTFSDEDNKEDITFVNNAVSAISFLTYATNLVVKYIANKVGSCDDSPEDSYLGGICGMTEKCEFDRCVNTAKLYNDEDAGGIAGYADGGLFNNCLNAGSMSNNSSTYVGSIVGCVKNQTKVTNCLATIDYPIIGAKGYSKPGSSGESYTNDADVTSGNNYRLVNGDRSNVFSYFEMQVDKKQIGDGTVAFWLNSGAENHNLAVKPWRQNKSGDYQDETPVLYISHNVVSPKDLPHTTIRNEEDLRAFAEQANGGDYFCNAILEDDIKMSSNELWTPIGRKDKSWRGVFDGQGHTISGLKCSVEDNSEEGAGLFGSIEVHADIRNVILDSSCEIEHKSSKHSNAYGAGGIVGTVRNTRRTWGNVFISNCGNYGKVTTSHHAGGILGRVINDGNDGRGSYVQIVIDNCFNSGVITAEGNSALLCGYMQNYGVVTNCWSNGSLMQKGSGRVFDMNNSNGLPEYFVGYDKIIAISDCYDYQSVVDWNDVAEEYQYQNGVTKQETTAIEQPTTNFRKPLTEIYTISGQKVNSSNLPAGLYIKNGKKFIKK